MEEKDLEGRMGKAVARIDGFKKNKQVEVSYQLIVPRARQLLHSGQDTVSSSAHIVMDAGVRSKHPRFQAPVLLPETQRVSYIWLL